MDRSPDPNEEVQGEVYRDSTRLQATIEVNRCVTDETLIESTVLHECLHIALSPLSDAMVPIIDSTENENWKAERRASVDREEEKVVCLLEKSLIEIE